MHIRRQGVPLVLMAVLAAGCAGSPSQSQGTLQPPNQGELSGQSRTLVMAMRYEPLDLAQKIPLQTGGDFAKRFFNAGLGLVDGMGVEMPYLSESLPQLDTDSWRIFPGGRMETTHKLRAGLTWHDGHPLTAEDLVFAWQVYTAPGLGVFSLKPQDQMEQVLAPDPRTLVIRWRSPYSDASALTVANFDPLPRHVLESAFAKFQQDPATRKAFLDDPFWAAGYVGAGPYRLGAWEPGVSIEGLAFDGHVLGRPKVDRLIMRTMADENTVLSNMLAEEIDLATRNTLRFEHMQVLRREWAGNRGVVLQNQGSPRVSPIQFRPEYLTMPALLDLRVRKALAHTTDKEEVRQALFDGQGDLPDTLAPRDAPYYSEVDRAIAKYPFDPRRSDQLMQEAGFTKDREGFFVDGAGERLRPDFRAITGPEFERTQAIVTGAWRRAGFEVQPSRLGAAEERQPSAQSTFPGISMQGGAGPDWYRFFASAQIGSPASNWVGYDRGGWSSPEYDRWFEVYGTTLEPTERNRQAVQMAKLVSEDIPAFFFSYSFGGIAHLATLRGPDLGVSNTTVFWNVHEWVVS